MLTRWNFDGPHVWDKPGLSGYLVCLVHLVSLLQPNKPDRPNRPNEQDRWRTFSVSCQTCLFSVASCNSDQILGGVFLATCGDLSASPPDPLS